ncbi:hypothetical protein [Arthrobacter sp. PAMC 25486]|uniref:hypothetical protein n=1 Tax=Arthrobacter sp. PAMC 25486 TaxID=1494608 RepID=UPI0012FE90DD|nr:hypothetical protein [Arthrobacter sp. PAMC 25486]
MSSPTPGKGKTLSSVGLSSLVAAACGYLVLIVASRSLTPADNANFLAFWGVLLGLFGVLTGLMTEGTRAVKSRRMMKNMEPHHGAPVLPVSLLIGAATALLVAASSPFWMPTLIPNAPPLLWLGIALSVLLYAGHIGLAGATAGLERWGSYSGLAATEAIFRLLLMALAAFVGGSLAGLEFGALSGTLVWLYFAIFSAGGRAGMRARADVGVLPYLVRCGLAMATAAATAILVTGLPAVIKIAADPADFALAAPLLLAVSLTRAPIMIPLQAFQGVVMTALIHSDQPSHRVLAKPFAAIVALGVVGAVAAALVGPWIMLIFGPDYSVDGWLLGALTLAAAFLAILTLTGTAAMALGRHRLYLAGWVVATVVSVSLLFVPGPLVQTVVTSLFAGPIIGALVHAAGVLRSNRLAAPAPSTSKDSLDG